MKGSRALSITNPDGRVKNADFDYKTGGVSLYVFSLADHRLGFPVETTDGLRMTAKKKK